MNEKNDDKWLDELISRTINTEKPQFNAEKWRQKYPEEFQILQSRSTQASANSVRWVSLLKSSITKLAAAAGIIIVIGFLVIHQAPDKKIEIVEVTNPTKTPAEMLTLRSLKIAYRNEGIEAVETQCEKAIEQLGSQFEEITIKELLAELNGT